MNEPLWVGLDLGTEGVRVTVVDSQGQPRSHAVTHFGQRTQPTGGMVHDPLQDWTVGALTTLRNALDSIDSTRVGGVGVCGLFPASTFLDAEGQPIGEALLYGDSRAADHVPAVARELGARLQGDEVSPRLVWLRETRPNEFARVRRVVGPAGFVIHLLTGLATIDPQSAYRWGGLTDASRTQWCEAGLQAVGASRAIMPDIVAPGRVVGHVTPAAAAATGLPRGTPVIGGATDSLATFLGHGAVRRDDTIIYYGSTWTVMVATCDLTKVLVEPSLIDDYVPWRLAAYGLNAGRFLENLRIAAFGGQTSEALDAAAAAVPAGARGVAVIPLPTSRFHGGQVSPSRGAIVGLGLAHTQADVWRAGLESLGYLVADGLDGGPPPTGRVVAAGGGARSATWRGVVSAITGLSQHYHPRGSAALGAALLAARGLGAVESLDAVAEGWLPDAETTCTRSEGAEVAAYCQERRAWRLYAEAVSQLDERREGLLTGGATT